MLGPIARDGEIVRGCGVGDARAAGFLRSEINNAGIQSEKEIVAAAVERKFLDLLLADEAGDVLRAAAYNGGVRDDRDFRLNSARMNLKIDAGFLADGEKDAGTESVVETRFGDAHFVFPDGEGKNQVAARFVGGGSAERSRFNTLDRYGGVGNRRAGGVGDDTRDACGDLGVRGRNGRKNE